MEDTIFWVPFLLHDLWEKCVFWETGKLRGHLGLNSEIFACWYVPWYLFLSKHHIFWIFDRGINEEKEEDLTCLASDFSSLTYLQQDLQKCAVCLQPPAVWNLFLKYFWVWVLCACLMLWSFDAWLSCLKWDVTVIWQFTVSSHTSHHCSALLLKLWNLY